MVLSRLGWTLFAGLSLAIGLVSLVAAVQPLDRSMPHVAHFLGAVPWPLMAHLLLAPLVMVLAPLQLWTGLRHRAPGLHRWSGRLYALTVLVAAPAGFALAASPASQASGFARVGFMVLAVLWLVSTVMGVVRARQGQFAAHRWWMQRSVALTFAAVTLRLIMAPLIMAGWTVAETYDVSAWGSWVLTLTALELWQRRSKAALAA